MVVLSFLLTGCGQVNSPASDQDFLQVSGRKIVRADGQPIVLQGLGLTNGVYNIDNPATLAQSKYKLTKQDYDELRRLGVNSVRFYLQYDWFAPHKQKDIFAYLDEQLKLAASHKIYVILNMHYFGTTETTGGGFYKGQDQSGLLGVWDTISRRYKDNPWVGGYDVINEPNCSKDFTEKALYQLYERIVKRIRANGDKHIVFVADAVTKLEHKSEWQSLPGAFQKLADNNIVYQYHWYQPSIFTMQGAIFNDPVPSLGQDYPFVQYLMDTKDPAWGYVGGMYENPKWSSTAQPDAKGWQMYEGKWVNFAKDANCLKQHPKVGQGAYVFNLSLAAIGLDGQVWFDDLVLEKRKIGSNQISSVSVPNVDFAAPRFYSGWDYPLASKDPAQWESAKDSNSTGIVFDWVHESLKIDCRQAKWSAQNPWSKWGQSGVAVQQYFPIEADYEYRVKAKVKIVGNSKGWVSLGFDIFKPQKKVVVNRESMASVIYDYYEAWGAANQVPIYCGEFGAANPALIGSKSKTTFSASQQAWVKDMLSILKEYNHGWAYHAYKSYLSGRPDLFGLYGEKRDEGLIKILQKSISFF